MHQIDKVDGNEVWNDGTLSLRDKETIDFSYLITSRVEGATNLKVLRQGENVELRAELVGLPSCLLCPIYRKYSASTD